MENEKNNSEKKSEFMGGLGFPILIAIGVIALLVLIKLLIE